VERRIRKDYIEQLQLYNRQLSAAQALIAKLEGERDLWTDRCTYIANGTGAKELGNMLDQAEAELKAAESQRDKAVALLRECEWFEDFFDAKLFCRICKNTQDEGHAPDCELSAILKEGGGEG
jgi:hypothetical protein